MREDIQKIENDVCEYIFAEKLLKSGQNVLLAVSGGADSVAMVEIFSQLIARGKLKVNLHLAHINHQLRGADSDGDEIFVKEWAKKLSLPIATKSVAVKEYVAGNKVSIETAARNLRFDALRGIAEKYDCKVIATAHHADDNAETLTHRLLRGTAFAGLAGIWPEKEFSDGIVFIRPLLILSRVQIESYLGQRQVSWRTDKTNADCRFMRNFIRHKLIPAIEEDCSRPLRETLGELAKVCRRFDGRVKSLARAACDICICDKERQRVIIDKAELRNLSEPVAVELIKIILEEINCGQQKITSAHYRGILDFVSVAKKGKRLSLPNDFFVTVDLDEVTFSAELNETATAIAPVEIVVGGITEFGKWKIETKILAAEQCDLEKFKTEKDELIEWFDMDKITLPLLARGRVEGDRFTPIGQKQPQKVGKFITSAKISEKNKKKLFLITDSKDVIWLVPARGSQIASITPKTKNILQVFVHSNILTFDSIVL
ncbi:MAG: tRNA lysidine(34) synthetase TilS [Anaerohalosphaeraceae bacterium]|nr:tRNA lysidine(34) synthetase TilS [Anaerohalosphaeraceae bacterium]